MYFKEDDTVSVVSAGAIVELDSKAGKVHVLEPGDVCHVKEKGKVYAGKVVTYGEYHEFKRDELSDMVYIILTIVFQVIKSVYSTLKTST